MKICLSCLKRYDDALQVCPHCGTIEGTVTAEPNHLAPGTLLADRYIIGKSAGTGGFGIVYKAWDTKLETIVAIKEYFPRNLVTRVAGEKDFIVTAKNAEEVEYRKSCFLTEARIMAKFGNNRGIPNVFEFFEENETAYIVMEFLKGEKLSTYFKRCNNKVDVEFSLMVANVVANVLGALHKENLVHRDVAPDNIFICLEGNKCVDIKVIDLGGVKYSNNKDDVVDIILKPGYSPAEQYDNSKTLGPWSDIYSLGATLYYILTGVKPDEATNRKIRDDVAPPNRLNLAVSENLSNAVMKAMAIDKHMRFKDVGEFIKAINGEKKVVTIEKEKKQRNIKKYISIVAASLILLVGSISVFGFYKDKKEAELIPSANISVWFSVKENSNEETAMETVRNHFESTFKERGVDVDIELRAIPESDYASEIKKAASEGALPTLFESSGLSSEIIKQTQDLTDVIASEQFDSCLFVEQYHDFYKNEKQIPLAIEVPMATVITNGNTFIKYEDLYFTEVSDFGGKLKVAVDSSSLDLLTENFGQIKAAPAKAFFNNEANTSPVYLSTTMKLNEVRANVTAYEKNFVFCNADEVYCRFIYEWSIGNGTTDEIDVAECLLSWMLGYPYQNVLMITDCNDGQIPVNSEAFHHKIESKYLSPIEDIYQNFKFKKES